MLSGNMHTLSTKVKLEGCINFSNNTPQLGESPQSNGEVISSPRSPDYPPRVSVSPHPHSPDTTFSISMMSANSTVMDTAKYNEESTNNVAMCTDETIEYPFCPSPSRKLEDSQVDITKTVSSKQRDTVDEKYITDRELKIESIEIKKEPTDSLRELEKVKSEQLEDSFSITVTDRMAVATAASQEKSTDTTVNSSSSSHSKTYSSSREKRSKEDRRHCSRCQKRKGIKRASIGVQCKRDRHVICGKPSLSFSKSTNENLRLNLQTKNYKMLNNPLMKSELLEGLKYKKYIHIETYPNGGATVVHMYQDEIDSLSREQMDELAHEYFKV